MSFSEFYSQIYREPYLQSLILFFGFFFISKMVIFISEKYIVRLTAKTKTKVDDLILATITRPISLILIFMGIKLAVIPLNIIPRLKTGIQNIASSIIIIIVTVIAIRIFKILIDNWGKQWAAKTHSTIDDQLISLLNRFSKFIFAAIGILLILDTWGIQIGPMLASLGIAGLAVAFALQSTLGNVFGGISLIIDKSIRVGDVIELDENTRGEVIDVGLRSTRIRTFNNEVIVIPNGKLADSKLTNYVLPEVTARLVTPFSVAYGSDIDKVKRTVLKVIHDIPGVLKDPEPFVRFIEMSNSSLNFNAYIWCQTYSERFKIKDIANTRIYNALNKARIPIPFPQLDVHMKK